MEEEELSLTILWNVLPLNNLLSMQREPPQIIRTPMGETLQKHVDPFRLDGAGR
jgi:hypothetical protein